MIDVYFGSKDQSYLTDSNSLPHLRYAVVIRRGTLSDGTLITERVPLAVRIMKITSRTVTVYLTRHLVITGTDRQRLQLRVLEEKINY